MGGGSGSYRADVMIAQCDIRHIPVWLLPAIISYRMVVPRVFADMMCIFRPASPKADGPIFGAFVADSSKDNADNLRKDAFWLADSLDGMETRDWVERVGSAVEFGKVKYAELLDRRRLLSLNDVEAASIDAVLDTIRARLKFLDSLHRRNTKH